MTYRKAEGKAKWDFNWHPGHSDLSRTALNRPLNTRNSRKSQENDNNLPCFPWLITGICLLNLTAIFRWL
jgi:hypothetical protein